MPPQAGITVGPPGRPPLAVPDPSPTSPLDILRHLSNGPRQAVGNEESSASTHLYTPDVGVPGACAPKNRSGGGEVKKKGKRSLYAKPESASPLAFSFPKPNRTKTAPPAKGKSSLEPEPPKTSKAPASAVASGAEGWVGIQKHT